jgi:hypothetical protein
MTPTFSHIAVGTASFTLHLVLRAGFVFSLRAAFVFSPTLFPRPGLPTFAGRKDKESP